MVVVISKFFAKFFHCHKFQRLSNYRRGKIQLNATHWTPISNMSMPSQWFLPINNVREGYKLHSLLGSEGKRAETNFNFPAPPFNHISEICKNLADTWPAATRVLSRGRKREDPGNEVVRSWYFTNYIYISYTVFKNCNGLYSTFENVCCIAYENVKLLKCVSLIFLSPLFVFYSSLRVKKNLRLQSSPNFSRPEFEWRKVCCLLTAPEFSQCFGQILAFFRISS